MTTYKTWFVNSRGQIIHSLNPASDKHELRIKFGNAFATKEEAKIAKKAFKLAFMAEVVEEKCNCEGGKCVWCAVQRGACQCFCHSKKEEHGSEKKSDTHIILDASSSDVSSCNCGAHIPEYGFKHYTNCPTFAPSKKKIKKLEMDNLHNKRNFDEDLLNVISQLRMKINEIIEYLGEGV